MDHRIRRAYALINTSRIAEQFPWWEWSIPDNRVAASARKVEMIGYAAADFADAGFEAYTDLLHPDDYERTMEAMRAHLEGRADLYQIDYRIRTKSGSYVWYMDRGAVVDRGPHGEPLLLRGIVLNLGSELSAAAADDAVVRAVRRALPKVDGIGRSPVICAQCGRIDSEPEQWIPIDDSFWDGFAGEISHTICPDCIRRLYPGAAERILARLPEAYRLRTRTSLLSAKRLVREMVANVLRDEPTIDLVGVAETRGEMVDALRSVGADVAIVGIEFEDHGSIEFIKQLRVEFPGLRILVYCICHDNLFAVRAVRAGARGFIDSTASVELLVRATRIVANGGFFMGDLSADRVVEEQTSDDRQPQSALSDREFQIMLLVAERKSVADIARRLNVSESTVSTHRKHVLEKMGFTTSAGLTRYAIEHDLISWDTLL